MGLRLTEFGLYLEKKLNALNIPKCGKCGKEMPTEIGHHIPKDGGGLRYVCHQCYDKYMKDERRSQERFNAWAKHYMERVIAHYKGRVEGAQVNL